MRKGLTAGLLICFLLALAALAAAPGQAEAANVTAANRELKKSRDYQHSSLYERAHRIIYGNGTPLGPQGRIRIAIILDGDENIIVEERVKNEVYQAIREKFPRESFAVMKGIDVKTKLLQYAEDNFDDSNRAVIHSHMGSAGRKGTMSRTHETGEFVHRAGNNVTWDEKTSQSDIDGLPVHPGKPRGLADMKRADYVRAGRECDYDYVFVATFSNGEYLLEKHGWILFSTETKKKNVWLRLRFIDTQSGDYVYRNDLVVTGAVGDQGGRPRMYQDAVRKAMREAMDDLEVDIY